MIATTIGCQTRQPTLFLTLERADKTGFIDRTRKRDVIPGKRAMMRARSQAPRHTSSMHRSLVLVLCVGCYRSHSRSNSDAHIDTTLVFDAGTVRDATHDVTGEPAVDAPTREVAADALVVAEALDGLRWELPCGAHTSEGVCNASDTRDEIVFGGTPAQHFEVTLRFRGVVETAGYTGGTREGMFRRGGSHLVTNWNLYALDVERPVQTFYLNDGPNGLYVCVPVDYQATVRIDGGARLVLRAEVFDDKQIANRDSRGNAIRVVDVPPYPAAFDGQFIQVDVVSVRELP